MVYLDAEEEHSARGRQNGWAYLRGHVTTPREASNFVARVPGSGGCARESLPSDRVAQSSVASSEP